jgi:fructokinase
MMLTEAELPLDMIRNARIFHFGTLSMTHETVRQATKAAVQTAKQSGAVISFDPNLREPLWESLVDAKAQMLWGLGQSEVVKIADNEIEFLTGTTDFDKGATLLRDRFPNIRLLNVTAGANGSYAYYEDKKVFVPSFLLGGTIETTGAGDTFCASVLNFVLERGLNDLTRDDLKDMLRFANAAAYLVTTRKGAIKSMPEREQVEAILKAH